MSSVDLSECEDDYICSIPKHSARKMSTTFQKPAASTVFVGGTIAFERSVDHDVASYMMQLKSDSGESAVYRFLCLLLQSCLTVSESMAVSSVRLAYDCAGRRRGFGYVCSLFCSQRQRSAGTVQVLSDCRSYIQFKHASSGQQASLIGLQHNSAHRVNLRPLRGRHTRYSLHRTQASDS